MLFSMARTHRNTARVWLLAFLLLLPAHPAGAQALDGSSLTISLLTCSCGDDVASAFGHSAIRVKDSISGADMVFNYGSYNFNEPHFVYKFMKGRLDYMLAFCSFDAFITSYIMENRSVEECVMNLSPEQKAAVYTFLVNNYQGRNRFYRYDYFIDNCATRIRDILIGPKTVTGGLDEPEHTPSRTYRTSLEEFCIGESGWLKFGLDALLGARIDKELTFDGEMYLPCLLEANLMECTDIASGNNILYPPVQILGRTAPYIPKVREILVKMTSPAVVFTALCVLFCLLFLFSHRRERAVPLFSRMLFMVLGLTGVLLAFMWFGTDHYWTKDNWNLLWADPLLLLPALIRGGRLRNIFVYVLTAISLATVPLMAVIPQELNAAVIPVAVLEALCGAATYYCGRMPQKTLRKNR